MEYNLIELDRIYLPITSRIYCVILQSFIKT